MHRLVIVQTLALATSFAAEARSVAPRGLPFHLTHQGGIIVGVRLDGAAPVPFLVDTGSNGSVVSAMLASKLGLPVVAKTTSASAVGQQTRLVVKIGQLAVGDVSADDVLATVMPDAAVNLPDAAADGTPVQGVVGQDVLAAMRYTIDYRERRIIWRDGVGQIPATAAVLALEARDHRFVAVLPQDRTTIRLVPDSGSEGLVLFERDGQLAPLIRWSDGRATVTGLSGTGEARMARVATLRVGSATLIDVPAVVIARAPAAQTSDGLLPLHIFARVTFNGPERQLVIERQ